MRENRPSGSEGGGVEANRLSLPLSLAALALGAAGRPRRNTPATAGSCPPAGPCRPAGYSALRAASGDQARPGQ
jgi:hypothetical protein